VQAASAPRITDPCKLLTQVEASEAAGRKLNPGELERFGGITRCTFPDPTDSEGQIFLDVHGETAPVADAALFDSYLHAPNGKPVSGIGDQAVWSHSEMPSPSGRSVMKFTSLDILKGGRLVEVRLPGSMTTITAGVEKAGKLIAGRM